MTNPGAEISALNRIEELRAQRGWSLNQLSRNAGLPEATLRLNFKRGTEPTLPTIYAVCKGLGIPVSEFFSTGKIPVVLTQEEVALLHLWEKQPSRKRQAVLTLLRD